MFKSMENPNTGEQLKINSESKNRIVEHAKFLLGKMDENEKTTIDNRLTSLKLTPELVKKVKEEIENIQDDDNFLSLRENIGGWYQKLANDKSAQEDWGNELDNPYYTNRTEAELAKGLSEAIFEEAVKKANIQ